MTDGVGKELENWLVNRKKVVIAGIGNPIRTDDYVGLKIIQDLNGKLPETVCLIEAETVPESYLLDIEEFHPSHVLLIDAAFLGLNPGEARLVDAEEITDFSAITTHLIPLRIFCDYVKQSTGAKIALLLIEPQSMEFAEGLTKEVKEAAGQLTKILLALLS